MQQIGESFAFGHVEPWTASESEAHGTTPIRNSGYPKPGGYHL